MSPRRNEPVERRHGLRGRRAALALLPAFLAALAGCGVEEEGPDPRATIDLLARPPDRVIDQPGVLVPEAEAWGRLGAEGWERATEELRGRDPFVWANRPVAALRLPAGPPRERAITLSGFAPPGPREKPVRVRVELAGTELGVIELGAEPSEHVLHAAEHLWREGENRLELASESGLVRLADGRSVAFALARVAYDRPRSARIDVEERRAHLAPGNALIRRIEPLAPAQLLFGGRARGKGAAAIAFTWIDPASGAPRGTALSSAFECANQEFLRSFPVPAATGDVLEARVEWRSDEDSELELSTLALVESEVVARPPVILIVIDSLSARHLSLHGHPRPTSPRLDAFAREALVFEQCVANAPRTLPSIMSLLSGLYPGAHRLEPREPDGAGEARWFLDPGRWTLPEHMLAAGYRTAAIVDNAWLDERSGVAQGFELLDTRAGDGAKSDPDGGIRHVARAALEFLDARAPGEPVFLFLHAADAHGPYVAGPEFRGRFRAPEGRALRAGGPANAYGIVSSHLARAAAGEETLPARVGAAALESAYDETIATIDAELGLFFDALREGGWLDRALIVVTADHGETMGAGDWLFGHGVLDQDVLHVPLIVRLPVGRGGGRRVAETVQLVDLQPTILDLLGTTGARSHLHGRSLLPFLEGRSRPASVALCEGGVMRQAALVAGGWKLVETRPGVDSDDELLLSHPRLSRALVAAAEEHMTREAPRSRPAAWREDGALVRDLFERLPASGLTEELALTLRSRAGYPRLMRVLRRAFAGPDRELYRLADDPRAERDLAAREAAKLAELALLLEAELARSAAARAKL